jgi:hypothetical protein
MANNPEEEIVILSSMKKDKIIMIPLIDIKKSNILCKIGAYFLEFKKEMENNVDVRLVEAIKNGTILFAK